MASGSSGARGFRWSTTGVVAGGEVAASIGPLASVIWNSSGRRTRREQLVAGDEQARTRRPPTVASPQPIELMTPRSCGRSARPASSTVVPWTMSSPRWPTFLPGETEASAAIRRRASSAVDELRRQHGVGPGRHRRAGPDADGAAAWDRVPGRANRVRASPATVSGTGGGTGRRALGEGPRPAHNRPSSHGRIRGRPRRWRSERKDTPGGGAGSGTVSGIERTELGVSARRRAA